MRGSSNDRFMITKLEFVVQYGFAEQDIRVINFGYLTK